MGGEFDRLRDGRERCVRCARTVVATSAEFADVFTDTRRNLETAFGITTNVGISVHMVNAREIARRTGEVFQPTTGVDARALGFATGSNGGYSLFIENGAPKLAAITTIAHELTHIWQYLNWDQKEVLARYGHEIGWQSPRAWPPGLKSSTCFTCMSSRTPTGRRPTPSSGRTSTAKVFGVSRPLFAGPVGCR